LMAPLAQSQNNKLVEGRKSALPPSDVNAVATAPEASRQTISTPAGYTIGEQDVLNVTVWKEPELSGRAVVRPDGNISLPLVNEIKVVGMTPDQLRTLLTEDYKPFITVPQVSVSVQEINSRKVYVIGQVSHAGAFDINSTRTVLEQISLAGGLKDFANRKKIYVLRTQKGKQVRLPFNYDQVIQGKNEKQNIVLQPGDTLVVP